MEILQEDVYVATGQIAAGSKTGIIRSTPLGSCVTVIAYDKTTKIGGLAHIMLPYKSPKNNNDENKYAENAITNLMDELFGLGASKINMEVCLVGGANVIRKKDDTIANDVVYSVSEFIKKIGLAIKETSLGGDKRRTATLNLSSGVAYYTIGDSKNRILYNFTK